MKLAVAFTWHAHPWEDLLDLVQRAEELGYAAAYVDGDVSMLGEHSSSEVLDGWTVTACLLARTRRIQVGSIRLVHHWNAARLAQAAATAERLAPGRLRFLISIGDRPHDERFGLRKLPAGERIRWLDETLTALRGLWRGEPVSLSGRYVRLDRARISPAPPGGRIPIAIAAGRPRMLELVAAHADCWEVNLPPSPGRVLPAAERLAEACRRRGRDPAEIARALWIFTRLDPARDTAAALKEYRHRNPWFAAIPDEEIAGAIAVGSPDHCRRRIAGMARELGLDLPVLDLSGLEAGASRRLLDALAPGDYEVDAGT